MRFTVFVTAALAAFTMSVEAVRNLQKFKVQTKVIEGNRKFDGLWASLYHTGAGTADVYFHNNRTAAFSAFLNHTQFQWVYTGVSQIPYALNLQYQTYATWGPLEVSPGYGSDYYGKGFVFKNGNQIVDKFEEWTGWLVCDWWHQVPQLFWTQIGAKVKVIPSCAKVQLIART
ncbi:hypothetical protein TWF106_010548 [Orbilia oligospora]|uniref:DUF7907 domain-containing protein n=1 Tax=Orbilia oligospora TaxID=2813651 RepID=A0A6G1M2F9_ORBOL|nr:hypothetical protein TWF788_001508 [Orbilia oligospora]KAF3214152.1 hypothetical protein TWF679_005018 [Orbilia oligospora]KAF3223442.1 hypothetical protein TWF191_006453 [Orbilia oligospora]KAF3227060.1 hypothetical protein TWF106_010548 [Orbilia oligospora]KAF3241570.1 hypothetical protein TWF192_008865 [Orbilia oligospora]